MCEQDQCVPTYGVKTSKIYMCFAPTLSYLFISPSPYTLQMTLLPGQVFIDINVVESHFRMVNGGKMQSSMGHRWCCAGGLPGNTVDGQRLAVDGKAK